MRTFDLLLQHVNHQPDHPLTIFEGRTTTYQQMADNARHLGQYLRETGLASGDVVALLLGNSDAFVTAYFACQAAGLTVLPVNIRLAAKEIEYILNHSEAKTLIYSAEMHDLVHKLKPEVPSLTELFYTGEASSTPSDPSEISLAEAITRGQTFSHRTAPKPDLDDTAVIFYTSGTTGRPKGVMLTHQNCVSAAKMWREAMGLLKDDRVQIVAPLFHCAAAHVFMLPTLEAGGTLVIERAFSPQQSLQTLASQDITVFFGVPAMYTLLLNLPALQETPFPHLRMFTYGASPMPYELVKRLKTLFPQVKVQNLYGQTENTPGATTLKDAFALTKIGSVGEPLPGCLVRIVDEEGNDLPPGQVGEIIVQGPHVMKGYLKNPEATAATLRDGWMYSGDLGRFDEDGLLYIVDRKKDMIIRGGENVYPVEVEEVLFQIPQILEAAVVGVPHEVYGEVPKAFVALKPGHVITEDEVIAFCLEHLAKYKTPVAIEFVPELPRNASGKVLKTMLRGEAR